MCLWVCLLCPSVCVSVCVCVCVSRLCGRWQWCGGRRRLCWSNTTRGNSSGAPSPPPPASTMSPKVAATTIPPPQPPPPPPLPPPLHSVLLNPWWPSCSLTHQPLSNSLSHHFRSRRTDIVYTGLCRRRTSPCWFRLLYISSRVWMRTRAWGNRGMTPREGGVVWKDGWNKYYFHIICLAWRTTCAPGLKVIVQLTEDGVCVCVCVCVCFVQ